MNHVSTPTPCLSLIACLIALACGPPLHSTQAATKGQEVAFAFWNLENLFDCEDDSDNSGDDSHTPAQGWTVDRYGLKITHLAEAIDALDVQLLGVCEVENRRVLKDLVGHPALKGRGYRIAHLDTPDSRGIDLGLLVASPLRIVGKPILHPIDLGKDERPTRGILEARVQVGSKTLTVLVNHWPSRFGGRAASAPRRARAAKVLRSIVDTQMRIGARLQQEAEILILGDFNDDPFDTSIRDVLRAVRELRAVTHPFNRLTSNEDQTAPRLYNPTWSLLADGDSGTYYYWNEWTWNVFDQVIVSPGLVDGRGLEYVPNSLRVHAPAFLRDTEENAHRPAPFRKFKGEWEEGYSDHFAVRGVLVSM